MASTDSQRAIWVMIETHRLEVVTAVLGPRQLADTVSGRALELPDYVNPILSTGALARDTTSSGDDEQLSRLTLQASL